MLFSAPAEGRRLSIREQATEQVPLATIAYRISAANADACSRREYISGLIVHDLTLYERRVRADVSKAFSMKSGFGVLRVVPGSAAADADIRVDDEILAIGHFNVEEPTAKFQPRSYRRMENFNAVLQAASVSGHTDLLIRRSGKPLRIPLRVQQGCGGNLVLSNSSALDAYSDGKHVVVTTGMKTLTGSADEMAFVIAHEMAHNALGHSNLEKKRGLFGLAGLRQDEIKADRLAVRLMIKAGYSPQGALALLRNASRRLWWNVSLDHPAFGTRLQNVTEELGAISQSEGSTSKSRP